VLIGVFGTRPFLFVIRDRADRLCHHAPFLDWQPNRVR
jgi:hypothetical protein